MSRHRTPRGVASSDVARDRGHPGPLIAVVVAVAVVVAIGSVIDDTLREWWWLVAAVGLGAGLVDLLTSPAGRGVDAEPSVNGSASRPRSAPAHLIHESSLGPGTGSHAVSSGSGRAYAPDGLIATVPQGPSMSGGAVSTGDAAAAGRVLTDGVWLDTPVLPAQPTAATQRTVSPPALVRRSAEPRDALWRCEALWVPKSSHEWADHEDAWAIDDTLGRAALADGASSAFMARQWAMAVTARFLDDPLAAGQGGVERWVARATDQWTSAASADSGSASWWAGASEQRGSYATLIGVCLERRESGDVIGFTATAVGDSCLVHLTPDCGSWRRSLAFPLEHPEDFGKHPELIATTGARADGSMPVVRSACGQLRRGDAVFLMSDALAQFALEVDGGGDVSLWPALLGVDQEGFRTMIDRARSAGRIEDDDSTLVRILI